LLPDPEHSPCGGVQQSDTLLVVDNSQTVAHRAEDCLDIEFALLCALAEFALFEEDIFKRDADPLREVVSGQEEGARFSAMNHLVDQYSEIAPGDNPALPETQGDEGGHNPTNADDKPKHAV